MKKTTELDGVSAWCGVGFAEGEELGNWRRFPLVRPVRSVAERRVFLIRVWKSSVVAGKERLANSLAIRETPLKSLVRSLKKEPIITFLKHSESSFHVALSSESIHYGGNASLVAPFEFMCSNQTRVRGLCLLHRNMEGIFFFFL